MYATTKDVFSEVAENYDKQRRSLVPCFDDFYKIPIDLIQTFCHNLHNPKILDLGCGTGLFSEIILKSFANADITLLDISEEMINVAKKKFVSNPNVSFSVCDYTESLPLEEFDIVISALSIHHVENEYKPIVYKNIYKSLKKNGIFINLDQVLEEYDDLNKLNRNNWYNFVVNSGLPDNQIKMWEERVKLDREALLVSNMKWLEEAGFDKVGCIYKYYNFVIIFCTRDNEL